MPQIASRPLMRRRMRAAGFRVKTAAASERADRPRFGACFPASTEILPRIGPEQSGSNPVSFADDKIGAQCAAKHQGCVMSFGTARKSSFDLARQPVETEGRTDVFVLLPA